MKSKNYPFIFKTCLVLFCGLNSWLLQAQWTSKIPQTSDTVWIERNQVIDANTVWMGGTVYTYDSAHFPMPGNYVSMYSTSDGGTNWKYKKFDIDPMEFPYLTTVSGSDGMKGWAGMYMQLAGTNLVLKTTNGGMNWDTTAVNTFIRPESFIDGISFKDAQNGIMYGDPSPDTDTTDPYFEIYRTTDGGNTWLRIPQIKIPEPIPGEYGSAGDFSRIGDSIWFSTDNGRIFYSFDGGQNWQVNKAGTGSTGYLHFNDHLHGICASQDTTISSKGSYEIKYTADGGFNWQYVKSPFKDSTYFWSMCLIPESNYILCSNAATLQGAPFTTLLSKDKGVTWTVIGTSDGLANAQFITSGIGYAGEGVSYPQNHGTKIFKYAGTPLGGLLTTHPINAAITLYPNPVQDKLTLDINLDKPSGLLILLNSMDGKLILKKNISNANSAHHEELDLKFLVSGTYTITISSPEGSFSKIIIKE